MLYKLTRLGKYVLVHDASDATIGVPLVRTEAPDGTAVSTVFLGIDHRHDEGCPVLFETMVFRADGSAMHQERWTSLVQALVGHAELTGSYLSRTRLHTVMHPIAQRMAN